MVVLVLVKMVILGGVNGQFGSVSGPCGSGHDHSGSVRCSFWVSRWSVCRQWSFWVGQPSFWVGQQSFWVGSVVILGRASQCVD